MLHRLNPRSQIQNDILDLKTRCEIVLFAQFWNAPWAKFFLFSNMAMQIEWTSATVRSWFPAYAQCPVHKRVQNSAIISHTLLSHFEMTIQKTLLTLVDKIRKMDPKYKIIWRNIITNNTRNTHGFFQMSIFPHQLLRHVNHLRRGRLRFSETGIMLERVAAVHRPRRPITFAQGTMSFRCGNKEPLYTPVTHCDPGYHKKRNWRRIAFRTFHHHAVGAEEVPIAGALRFDCFRRGLIVVLDVDLALRSRKTSAVAGNLNQRNHSELKLFPQQWMPSLRKTNILSQFLTIGPNYPDKKMKIFAQ